MRRNAGCTYGRERSKLFATTVLGTLLVLLFLPSPAAASAFVRVNQMGYEVSTSSRAYLMSSGSEQGATFRVLDANGTTIFSQPVDNLLGSWGRFTVYGLDFKIALRVCTPLKSTALFLPLLPASESIWQKNCIRLALPTR